MKIDLSLNFPGDRYDYRCYTNEMRLSLLFVHRQLGRCCDSQRPTLLQ